MTKSITTYQFPTTYQEGNWIQFNIYVQEHTRFNEGKYRAGERSMWLAAQDINVDPTVGANVLNGLNFAPRPPRTGGNVIQKGTWAGLDIASQVQMRHIETSIGLYLPENIAFTYGVDWTGEDLGLVRSLAKGLGHVKDKVESFVTSPSWTSFKDIMEGAAHAMPGDEAAGLTIRMMAGMASLAGIPADRLFDKHQKKVINKHTELHFNGVNLRQFQFAFKFYPRNKDEALQIRAITDTFKFHMHPELTNNTTGLYMMYPSQFEIMFMRGWKGEDDGPASSTRNLNVAKVGRVALTDCSISHGEGEYVPIKGDSWSPTNTGDFYNSYTEMKLTFHELVTLSKKDILEGM